MFSQFFVSCLLLVIAAQPIAGLSPPPVKPIAARATDADATVTPASSTVVASTTGGSITTSSSAFDPSAPPDVLLHIPELHVGRIELDVDNLQAEINLAANVASLVKINAGVQISVQKINVTIADVDAELDLVVRLGHLVDIINRVFGSLDLNPLLINTLNNVTQLVDTVIGAVDGLLGSITQNGSILKFIVDNLGNIVQEVTTVAGDVTSTIVGSYLTNMTDTGVTKVLTGGLTQKTFLYAPLNALVDIVLNTAGQVVSAVVQSKSGTGSGSGSTAVSVTSTAAASATVTLPVGDATAVISTTAAAVRRVM